MTAVASINTPNSITSTNHPSYYDGSFGDVVDNTNSNKKRAAAGVEYMQIVVPTAGSGERRWLHFPYHQGGY
jgi:hypothetical protein